MNALFSQLLRQSLTAGWIILALLALRPLLKKVPRWVSCLLWSLPGLRLLLPAAPESRVSLVPQQLTAGALNLTPIPMTHIPVPTTAEAAPAAQHFSWEAVLPWLWLAGMAALAVYALFSYIRLLRRVQVSIRVGDRVFICDNVRSPFILGLFRPRIYLPSDMDQNRAKLVLSHERSHLRRGDHLWKPLGYALLCLHWFNPLCWAAYLLFCRDIEQACDEAVVKDMEAWEKKAYSAALAACSVPRSAIAACPLAFGEVGVKQRIRGILNYRKPKFWVMVLSAVLCAALAAGFLTDPVKASQPETETQDPSPVEDYLTYPREVTVYSAADKTSRELARYPAGMPVSLDGLEVVEGSIWGYVQYQDGQTRGYILLDEIMDAFTNRQHRFSQNTPIYSSPSLQAQEIGRGEIGDVYLEHYMEPYGNNIWGYIEYQQGDTTILGWILLNEGEAPAYSDPILTGTVIPTGLNVRSGPSTMEPAVGKLEEGTRVSIYEVTTQDDVQWGRIGLNAWVCMAYIHCEGDASMDDISSDSIEATLYAGPDESAEERYPFSQETKIYSSPSEQGREVYRAAAGEVGTITKREFIADGSWAYMVCNEGSMMGWVHLTEEDEALNYFREYVAAYSQPEPDEAEKYLYFASEYAREFFRDMYAPVTGWYPSGIFRVNGSLWGIEYSDSNSDRMVYSFVGRMDGRLYVFQNVHQVPETLCENLDVTRYEEENAMYVSEGYMECSSVIKRLLPFASPTRVTLEDKGTRDYSAASPCPLEDVICGTDTWREVEKPNSYGSPSVMLWLTAPGGSVAAIVDSSPVITVSGPDGSQQYFQAAYTGQELVGMIYTWAKELS